MWKKNCPQSAKISLQTQKCPWNKIPKLHILWRFLLWLSITLTLKVMLALFPDGSVNVYVTGVVPMGKKDPGALVLWVNEAVPELSVAVGSIHETWATLAWPPMMKTVMSSSEVMTGGIVSAVYMRDKAFKTNVAIQSVRMKGFRANADVWTPVVYFYGINRIGSSIWRQTLTLSLAGFISNLLK